MEEEAIMEEQEPITKGEADELRAKVAALKQDFAELTKLGKEKVATATAQWAKESPLAAFGVAAGVGAAVGFALGLLVGRGRG